MSINRVEIINHSKYGKGREYVLWKDDIEVTQSIQDQGKTLKVFIRDKGTVEQVNESNTDNQETQRNIFAEMAKALTDELYNDEYGYYQDWCDRAAGIMSPFVDEIIKEAEARGEARGAEKVIKDVSEYLEHSSDCIISFYEAGRPTIGGGYERKFKGRWYEVRPIDKTPKCDCGLSKFLTNSK